MQAKGKQASTQLFQKSLPDLVKGIRKHKKNEQEFIQKSIQEIKEELKHRDMGVKVAAVQKMTYLHMIGYNMEFGAFTIVEVMSNSDDFNHKRIGFLACAQSFHDKVEMVQMLPNLLRNHLKSANQWEQGVALSTLSNICNPELAEILVSEVANLLSSQRPYIRKKCLLTLFKIFLQYPAALRPCFPRIKEKLEDPDPSVTAAAVNVICELARKNPKNYLGMAPVFFKLFSNIQTNWTLIKIVKVFGALAPEEPRLPKKLAEPLTRCINTTPAKSLLYEALITVASNAKSDSNLMQLAVEKLRTFVQDPDQNLKYLGLKGLVRVMKNSPAMLSSSKDLIIECLGDEDISIRMSALDLVGGLVSKRNLHSVITKMQEQLSVRDDDDFRNTIVKYIVDICKQQNYVFVTNFEWYLRVLMDLTQSDVQRFENGAMLETEFMNVIIRVKAVRAFGVKCMCSLLCNPMIYQKAENTKSSLCKVLKAAAYLASEYVKFVPNKLAVVSSLMKRRTLPLPADIQAVIIQAALKIYAFVANPNEYREGQEDSDSDSDEEAEDETALSEVARELIPELMSDEESKDGSEAVRPEVDPESVTGLEMFLSSCDVDVHEHAASVKALIELHQKLLSEDTAPTLSTFFCDNLKPVRAGAQSQVEVTADLDTPIFDYIPEYSDDDSESTMSSSEGSEDSDWLEAKKSKKRSKHDDEADRKKKELERKNNPHYLPTSGGLGEAGVMLETEEGDADLPPVSDLGSLGVTTELENFNLGTKGFTEKASKKTKKVKHKMMLEDDAPEGFEVKKTPEPKQKEENERSGVWAELDVDLSGPVKEALPTVKPYERKDASDVLREEARKKKKDKKKKKKKGDESEEESEEKDVAPLQTAAQPQGVVITTEVVECSRRKKKKGVPGAVVFGLLVKVDNHSKNSLRSVAVKVGGDGLTMEAGEGFESTKPGVVNHTADGHGIKVAKGAAVEILMTVEAEEMVPVLGVVSYTSKDVPESHEVAIVRGAMEYLVAAKKANRETFFEVMGDLNKGDASTVKEPIEYEGDLKAVLSVVKEKCRLKVVEVLDDCAACMGTLITPSEKHNVCLLLKASSDSNTLTAELKTSAQYSEATGIVSSLAAILASPGDEDAGHAGYERAASPMRFLGEPSMEEEKPKKSKKEKKEKKEKPVKEPKKEKKSKKVEEEVEKEKPKIEKKDKKAKASKKSEPKAEKEKEKEKPVDSLGFLDM